MPSSSRQGSRGRQGSRAGGQGSRGRKKKSTRSGRRRPSAYNAWVKERAAEWKRENPGRTFSLKDVLKNNAGEWQRLSEAQKARYSGSRRSMSRTGGAKTRTLGASFTAGRSG